MSKINRDDIQKETKQILDKFAKALLQVEKEHDVCDWIEREEFERSEKEGKEPEKGFRQKMLENAPSHDEDFIIAERGSWK